MACKKRLILRAATELEIAMIRTSCLQAVVMLTVGTLLLAACGGGSSQPTATPTSPPPTVTPFPTFAFVEPTKAPVFEQSGDEDAEDGESDDLAVELDPKLVGRGRGRFEALECGNCHGANGEGTDLGKSLLDFDLTEEDFVTFMRSGGELGTVHQFSTDRLSNSGSRNLYQYLLSIAQGD